jgi:hypothetical protein
MFFATQSAALMRILGQADPFDDPNASSPPPTPAIPTHSFSFSDLQQGLRTANHGDPHDRTAQITLMCMVATVAVIALVLHLRQRRKEAAPLNSSLRLAWELARQVRFPWGSRLVLLWVARSAKMPLASLLISGHAFDAALEVWFHRPTFGPLRKWGMTRLAQLRPVLFG